MGVDPALTEELTRRPLHAIRSLFDRTHPTLSPEALARGAFGDRELFEKHFADDAALSAVQDIMDPEFYVGAFRQPDGRLGTAKYADRLPGCTSPPADSLMIWERKPLCIAPVPGQTAWALASSACSGSLAQPTRNGDSSGCKRPRPDEEVMLADGDNNESGPTSAGRVAGKAKRPQAQSTQGPAPAHAPTRLEPLYAPGSCIVHVYDGEAPKLNEVVEVIGVLSRTPELATPHLACAPCGSPGQASALKAICKDDELAVRPPTSLVPRVHGILVRRPACPAARGVPGRPLEGAELARNIALHVLCGVLGGDVLAAEYLLLQLVSRVYRRSDDLVLGSLSVNLTGCPRAEAPAHLSACAAAHRAVGAPGPHTALARSVTAVLAALTPYVVALPLSVRELNAAPLCPSRAAGAARLRAAPLQLAPGTALVLDETALSPGQLSALGVANLQALRGLLDSGKVDYDFGFYALPMPADVPVTVLSAGVSLLARSVDVIIPLLPAAPWGTAGELEAQALDDAALGPVRAFLASARASDLSIGPDMAAWLEGQLVAARKSHRGAGPKLFHTWLTMARLVALSWGETELQKSHWAAMQRLEQARAERLNCIAVTSAYAA